MNYPEMFLFKVILVFSITNTTVTTCTFTLAQFFFFNLLVLLLGLEDIIFILVRVFQVLRQLIFNFKN